MRYLFSKKFVKSYGQLQTIIQKKFDKQLGHLLKDVSYPSLQVKKYDKQKDIWQARVDKNYRFYFLIQNDLYILLDIRDHPK
ncbi:MAG: hypothetical protein Q7R99_00175 [bacterium]|nr:hypothetical protein [bacterium]